MKKTGMAKSDAKKLMGKMAGSGAGIFGAAPVPPVDRREQRKLDPAQGLVPFSVKLNATLVQQLQAAAVQQEVSMNDLVATLLQKSLAADA